MLNQMPRCFSISSNCKDSALIGDTAHLYLTRSSYAKIGSDAIP